MMIFDNAKLLDKCDNCNKPAIVSMQIWQDGGQSQICFCRICADAVIDGLKEADDAE